MDNENKTKETFTTVTEQFEVAGGQLVEQVKALFEEGNVRRIVVRSPEDKVLLDTNLNAGVVVGGVLTMMMPWVAALTAIAAVVGRARIEIVRDVEAPGPIEGDLPVARPTSTGKQKVKIQVEDDSDTI